MLRFIGIFFFIICFVEARTLVVDSSPFCFWRVGFKLCYSCEANSFFPDNPFTSIQKAINAAQDGDTVKICQGDYREQVILLKNNITLTSGADVATPTDVNWYYNGDVLKIGDSNHQVKNLLIENISIHSFSSSSNDKAIHINYAQNKITFQNLVIKTEGADAIYGEWGVDKNTDGVFKNLTIQSKGNGIYLNQGDIQSFENISINLLGNNGNFKGIYLGTGVKDKNHIFKYISLNLKAEPAIALSSGKSMVFEDINITATNYDDNTKAIYTDYNTDGNGDLSFNNINISVNKGSGIYISKAKNINAQNIMITGTTNIGAFFTDTQVSGDHSFENIYFDVKADHGLQIKRGKDLSIHNATIKGSSGNGWAIRADWNVVGNYNFKDINITAHAGGISIAKGNRVTLDNVKVSSDSTSVNDPGIKFEWSSFDYIKITNSEINATGIALWINGSDDLLVDSCKLITKEDKALYISTNVDKAHIQNSCSYNKSNGSNSYAIYSNNYKTNIHFNNNCLYATDGGNYALDQKNHDWDGNYWDGVIDSNGDGKISNADTNKISANIVDNSPLSSCPNSCGGGSQSHVTLMAEYKMDECSWNGVNGEVKDSSGNGYNGTAQIADTKPAFLCMGGDFTHISQNDSDDSDDDLVKIPKETLNGLHDFTFTTWIKTAQSGKFTLLSAARASGTKNEVWLYFNSGSTFYPWIKGKRNGRLTLSQSLNDNNWHHIAVTRKDNGSSSEVCIVVDGDTADKKCKNINRSGGALIVDGVVLAQDQDSLLGGYQRYQEFNGYMDEVKIFDKVLSDAQINEIYNNEKSKKNYDGTNRTCSICCGGYNSTVIPIEFEGGEVTLKNTYSDPTWTHVDFNKTFSSTPVVFMAIDTKGRHPASVRVKNITKTGFDATLVEPQGMDGPHISQTLSYFAINKGVHKIGDHFIEVGTIDTKKVQGRFLNPSQNDIGWEKINVKVPFCNPSIIANIQSLNNEKGNIPKKPSKPWMTAAVETNSSGVYVALDASETTNGYPLTQSETIGYMVAEGNIQGSFVDDYGIEIDFETILTDPYFVGWDDGCKKVPFINNYLKKPLIAGWKDSRIGGDGGWFRKCFHSKSQIGFVVDEDTAHDSERYHVAEKGAIFAFSDNFHFSQEQNQTKNYRFDAWDTFRNINDRNISTKIVNKPFTLTIASLDESGASLQEFNGTVCATIDRTIQKAFFQNETEKNLTFNVDRAIKDIKVKISWKKNVDVSCPLSSEDNSTLSTDNFAIRPDRFEIVPTPPYYAGDDFNISFYAKDEQNGSSKDYNESYNSSFIIEANETKVGCKSGTINLDAFHFTDGEANNIRANYDEIGDINITIKEINGSEFARVDQDDTNDLLRLITSASSIIHVKPYEANITDVRFEISIGQNWLYMVKDSNISEMNVTVGATVALFSKNGEKLSDFNSSCYGEDVKVKFYYDVTNTNDEDNITLVLNGSDSDGDNLLSDINKTLTFEKDLFLNGEAKKNYAFDINRSFYLPLSPLHIQLENVTIKSSVAKELHDANQTGKIKSEQNATFYYARVYPEDLTTSNSPDTTKVYILIYDDKHSLYTKELNQTLLHWYINGEHNDPQFGAIVQKRAKRDIALSSFDSDVLVDSNLKVGYWEIELTHNSDKEAYIHLDISPWLWFSYSRDFFYSFEPNSTCAQHPCIHYRYSKDHEKSGVESGNVGGTDFEQNVSKRNRGVKIFR